MKLLRGEFTRVCQHPGVVRAQNRKDLLQGMEKHSKLRCAKCILNDQDLLDELRIHSICRGK